MTKDQAVLGARVKAVRGFSGVPIGTDGVIDELYPGGFIVAWDLPDGPLPAGYTKYDGVPAVRSRILRDGFDIETELDYLEAV